VGSVPLHPKKEKTKTVLINIRKVDNIHYQRNPGTFCCYSPSPRALFDPGSYEYGNKNAVPLLVNQGISSLV
jgi:hypothetical protein